MRLKILKCEEWTNELTNGRTDRHEVQNSYSNDDKRLFPIFELHPIFFLQYIKFLFEFVNFYAKTYKLIYPIDIMGKYLHL